MRVDKGKAMVWFRRLYTGEEYKAVVLIAILMNELALADKYESLQEVAEITPNNIGLYARRSFAALYAYGKFGELPKAGQNDDILKALIAASIATAERQRVVTGKQVLYAEAAAGVLRTFQKNLSNKRAPKPCKE